MALPVFFTDSNTASLSQGSNVRKSINFCKTVKVEIAGVIENMSGFPCPHCGEPIDLFGIGGGTRVAEQLSEGLSTQVPLLGRIPFDVRLREGGDQGAPLVLTDPSSPGAASLIELATTLARKPRGLTGVPLNISPAAR